MAPPGGLLDGDVVRPAMALDPDLVEAVVVDEDI
jgi:hypothetical protein